MFLKTLMVAMLGSATLFEYAAAANAHGPLPRAAGGPQDYANLRASIIRQRSNQYRARAANSAGNNSGSSATAAVNQAVATTCLNAKAIQTGSASTGQSGVIAPGQVESLTDAANFINFCDGETLTNGLQVKTGSCNGIVMGKIPSVDNMISSVLINPQPGQDLPSNTSFAIQVQMTGLAAGSFTNAQLTYYSAPQNLDKGGKIVGHTHVTVQDLGNSLTPSQAPDPKTFVFFKGINDAGNGKGLLSATVTGGLPPGNYRVCTMVSSSNHQPALMPVAQRGAQDDCTKFTVGGGSPRNKGGAKGSAKAGGATSVAAAVSASSTPSSSSTSLASVPASSATGKGKAKGKGNR